MKSSQYNYVKLCFLGKYAIISIFVIRAFCLIFFFGSEWNASLFGLVIYILIILYITNGSEERIIITELKRRINKLAIQKENYFTWQRNKGEVGIFFTDPEKGTFWFCGSQTNYDLYVYPIMEFDVSENADMIFFRKKTGDCDIQEFRILKKYSKTS